MATAMAEIFRKKRIGYRNSGLCITCGGKRVPGYSQCSLCRKRHKDWRESHRDYIKDYQRHNRLETSRDGKRIHYKVNKRTHPGNCELCYGDGKPHLVYHHWDDLNPSKGLWLCFRCHNVAEFIEDGLDPNNYLILKEFVDGCY